MTKPPSSSDYEQHKKTYYFGITAEYIAIIFLVFKGYIILNRRYKTNVGEIDIIAKRKKTLAIIEVKARHDDMEIGGAVSNKQQKRICRAASVFLSKTEPRYFDCNVRFDIILIRPFRLPEHLQDAWRGVV